MVRLADLFVHKPPADNPLAPVFDPGAVRFPDQIQAALDDASSAPAKGQSSRLILGLANVEGMVNAPQERRFLRRTATIDAPPDRRLDLVACITFTTAGLGATEQEILAAALRFPLADEKHFLKVTWSDGQFELLQDIPLDTKTLFSTTLITVPDVSPGTVLIVEGWPKGANSTDGDTAGRAIELTFRP